MLEENRKLNAENLILSERIGRLRIKEMNAKFPEEKSIYREQIAALQYEQQENLKRMNR